MNKTETLQIRIDTELKDQFFKIAEELGYSPSEYVRFLMERTVNGKGKVNDNFDGIWQTLLCLIQNLFRASYSMKDKALFNELTQGILL